MLNKTFSLILNHRGLDYSDWRILTLVKITILSRQLMTDYAHTTKQKQNFFAYTAVFTTF